MHRRLILFTFVQSFATVLLERGMYFYTLDRLAFSDRMNLWLALTFGASYAIGAINSHRVTVRHGERTTLLSLLLLLLIINLTMGLRPSVVVCWLGFAAVGLMEGMKWPIIESYLTAGTSPDKTVKVLGAFNMAWSSSIPLSLWVAGPLIGSGSPTTFILLAASLHIVSLPIVLSLPRVPTHMAHDHPHRPPAERLARYRGIAHSARWSLLGSCAMLFLLAPLLPTIFTKRLGFSVELGTGMSAIMDVMRMVAFFVLGTWPVWRGRRLPVMLGALGLPVGFLLILFAPTTSGVIAGQIAFGLSGGMVYSAALYHAMVVHNASVQAGGQHESLIGLGFALGPIVGLIGLMLQRLTGSDITGMLIAVLPFIAVFLVASLRPLYKLRPQART